MDNKTKLKMDAASDLNYYHSRLVVIATNLIKNGVKLPKPLLDSITDVTLAIGELTEGIEA